MAWQDNLKVYRKNLWRARKDDYSALIDENKNKPRILFSTVARLTESHHSIEHSIAKIFNKNKNSTLQHTKIFNTPQIPGQKQELKRLLLVYY